MKEVIRMLDRESTDRSYLFGRYQACVEEMQYYVNNETQVVSKDARNISLHPQRLIKWHQELLDMPHKDFEGYRLLEMMIAEILDKFEMNDFTSNEKLGELQVLGYWQQQSELRLLKMHGLATVRKFRGLTQQELSDKSGVPLKTLQKYETGENDIKNSRANIVLSLAEALDCNMTNLI